MKKNLNSYNCFSSIIASISVLIKRLFFSHCLHLSTNKTIPEQLQQCPTMPNIPSELYFQLLLHLPADSLLRFRAVCKSWRLIIDDPSFIKSHTLNPHSSPSTLLIRDSRCLYYAPTPSSRYMSNQALDLTRIEIVTGGSFPLLSELPTASCHGLILLYDLRDFKPRAGWVIWNPLNRTWRRLSSINLVDLSSSNMDGVGFGYDHASDDYKVVLMRSVRRVYGVYQTLVYSLKSGKWKAIQDWPLPSISCECVGVYLNGALYWLCESESAIVVLDLASEMFRLLRLPPKSYEVNRPSLDVLDGCLFVRYYRMWKDYEGKEDNEYDVWMMEGEILDETKWIKVLSSEHHGFVGGNYTTKLRPVAYSKRNGEIVMQHGRNFYSFDVGRNFLKKVTIDGFPRLFRCQSFQGSLVRLGSGGGGSVHLTAIKRFKI